MRTMQRIKRNALTLLWMLLMTVCMAFGFAACDGETESKGIIQGVAFEDASYVYDGEEKAIVVSGLPDGASVSYVNNTLTNVGEIEATATVKQSGYEDLVLKANLTVSKKTLTVSAVHAEKKMGEENPTFTVSYEGFVQGEDESVLKGSLSIDCSATAESPAGTYLIKPSGLSADNYEIVYVNGQLTVTKDIIAVEIAPLAERYFVGDTFKPQIRITVNGEPAALQATLEGTGVEVAADGTITVVRSGEISLTATCQDAEPVALTTKAYHKVTTAAELSGVRDRRDGWYMLMNDIDLQGSQFLTLAHFDTLTEKGAFTGVFDGNGYTIANFTPISGASGSIDFNSSLFGDVAEGAVVRNLSLIGVTINSRFGGAVATRNMGTIENCFVSATVLIKMTANANPGGTFAGKNYGKISNCIAIVEGGDGVTNDYYGAIAGRSYRNAEIENCYALSTLFNVFETSEPTEGVDVGTTTNVQVVSTLSALNALAYDSFGDIWTIEKGVYPHLRNLTEEITVEQTEYSMLVNSSMKVAAKGKYSVYFTLAEATDGVNVSADGTVTVDGTVSAGVSFTVLAKSYYTTDEKEITVTIREANYEIEGSADTMNFDFIQGVSEASAYTKAHGITVLCDGQPYAGEDVTITSNNTSVARVDGDNVVAVGDGTATIEVKVLGTVKYTIAVNSVMYRPIRTATDFNAIGTDATTKSYKYKLMNDIDVQGGTLQTVSHNDTGKNFTGIFDGNGYTISNFSATTNTENKNFNCSLFGNVSGTIRNLNVVNMVINTRFGGGIATLNWGTIENCYVQATFSGEGTKAMAGGIACKNSKIIKNCVAVISYAEGETGTAVQGGIVGQQTNANAVIENCYLLSTDVAMLGSTASTAGSKTTNVQVVKTAEELKALDYTTFGDTWDYTGTYPTLKP